MRGKNGLNGSVGPGKAGGKKSGKTAEARAESIDFGPLAYWVGFNLRMAQESAFQAFSRIFAAASVEKDFISSLFMRRPKLLFKNSERPSSTGPGQPKKSVGLR